MDEDLPSQAFWLADNISSFALHAAAGLLFLALALFLTRSPRFALLLVVCAVPFAGLIAHAGLTGAPVGACPAAEARLRVATVNLLISNRDRDALAGFLAARRPDVVAFLEVGDFWDETLPSLLAGYPYEARSREQSTRLYSRIPFAGEPVPSSVPGLARSLTAEVAMGDRAIRFIIAHLAKPTTATTRETRRAQIDAVGRAATESELPVVVMGDFNAAPTALDFRALMIDSTLMSPTFQVPPLATWPARFGPLGIQIDHILLTAPLAYEAVAAGPPTGSNHLPLVADIALGPCTAP